MRFRLLHTEEQSVFDEDFKHFLISNGVSNEEWLQLNEKKDDRAQHLVALFSDIIFQKVYENVKYMEFRSPNQLLVFKCDKNQIHLMGLESTHEKVDFSTENSIALSIQNYATAIQMYRKTKAYKGDREVELFEMAEKGALASTETFWNTINKLSPL